MIKQELQYKNQILKIETDDDPESPRQWDNFGIMVCYHPNYNLGDVQRMYFDEYLESEGLTESDIAVKLPLWLYDHSGISMSCGDRTYPYNDQWDSGLVGTIYVTKESLKNC